MSGDEDLDARAAAGETVVPGGTGGRSLQAQRNLALGTIHVHMKVHLMLAFFVTMCGLCIYYCVKVPYIYTTESIAWIFGLCTCFMKWWGWCFNWVLCAVMLQDAAEVGRPGQSSWGTKDMWRWAGRVALPPVRCLVDEQQSVPVGTLMSPSSPTCRFNQLVSGWGESSSWLCAFELCVRW